MSCWITTSDGRWENRWKRMNASIIIYRQQQHKPRFWNESVKKSRETMNSGFSVGNLKYRDCAVHTAIPCFSRRKAPRLLFQIPSLFRSSCHLYQPHSSMPKWFSTSVSFTFPASLLPVSHLRASCTPSPSTFSLHPLHPANCHWIFTFVGAVNQTVDTDLNGLSHMNMRILCSLIILHTQDHCSCFWNHGAHALAEESGEKRNAFLKAEVHITTHKHRSH